MPRLSEINFIRKVRLHETDATGILYFTELLKFATEAFEHYLASTRYKQPIVSAKATYTAPLYWNDEVCVTLSVSHIGHHSFTLKTRVMKGEVLVGATEIVHATDLTTLSLLKEKLVALCESDPEF